ncbi:hypothetical protein CVU76_01220 [Candidatus Dojkabacteria bacterium HGW-Dojkabacteria-1]|uniref:DUF456 domain-containing protein n=1 Tax=Candidatus Dojkabacteria bacterium HGW-Dojkabacteria-1 TaxID=2013761 RepID=A0A2N2F374_9BACT|nr:MAG: hypothetical protein CVU76_01220 [Candidatus Dojkabacteria bacterium HGW-Dojkabacteria-1]
MLDIILYTILALLSISGVILTVLTLPGVWLVYIAVFILAWMGSFEIITPLILVILFVLSVFSTIADNIVMALGAKKLGGSNWGMLGAILGGIVGLMVGNILGMFVGPIVGATLFELIFARKDFKSSFKAGIGSFIGLFLGIVLKVGFTIGMIVYVLSLVI